jgi:2EXR family
MNPEYNTMSPTAMLCTFPLFRQLPMELQNLIWQMTLLEPRAISLENCFREWWHGRIVSFLSPVALHVCHSSRALANSVLKHTSIHIPGVRGWRQLYVNQACDFFIITKRDVEMKAKISDFITDPTIISRVMVTGIASDELLLKEDIVQYFGQFSGLEEVATADRGCPESLNISESLSKLVVYANRLA